MKRATGNSKSLTNGMEHLSADVLRTYRAALAVGKEQAQVISAASASGSLPASPRAPREVGIRHDTPAVRYELPYARSSRRRVLRLPDLDHCKTAVLNSLGSPASGRVYEYAIDQFIAWYCSEPRRAFNRIEGVAFELTQ
jgi:hypothetical protein